MFHRPALLLRIEAAVVLLASVLLYRHLHFSWILFAVLFLVPDLSMLGFLLNPRAGSALYNAGHVLFFPIPLFLIAYMEHWPLLMAVAIIWTSHIALDRLLGYGLKYPTHFKDTHLQHLG